jgi:cytochrome b561
MLAKHTMNAAAPGRYPLAAAVLHWVLAALIVVLLITGWTMVDIPRDTPERAFFFNLHKSLGIVTAIPIVAMIVWRLRHRVPPLPAAMPNWEKRAAVLNHRLFYILMIVATVAGYLTSSFSKYGPKLFGIELPYWGWDDEAMRNVFVVVHRGAALVFAVLIAVHVGAAVKHWVWDKDGVFERMFPRRRH